MAASTWVWMVAALAVARLPKPPEKVVLESKYGDVAVDHRAHLARRAPCVACHGAGPVRKIGSFGMTLGHERCRGCHKDEKRGPFEECKGCHVGPKRVDM